MFNSPRTLRKTLRSLRLKNRLTAKNANKVKNAKNAKEENRINSETPLTFRGEYEKNNYFDFVDFIVHFTDFRAKKTDNFRSFERWACA
jgi:hypothetical protein